MIMRTNKSENRLMTFEEFEAREARLPLWIKLWDEIAARQPIDEEIQAEEYLKTELRSRS